MVKMGSAWAEKGTERVSSTAERNVHKEYGHKTRKKIAKGNGKM